jgi:hypothetical protein
VELGSSTLLHRNTYDSTITIVSLIGCCEYKEKRNSDKLSWTAARVQVISGSFVYGQEIALHLGTLRSIQMKPVRNAVS